MTTESPTEESAPAAAPVFKAGENLAGYRLKVPIQRTVGDPVWLAADDQREAELHFLSDEVRSDELAVTELRKIVRDNRQLIHPLIGRIEELVVEPGWAAIAMDVIEGDSLAVLLKRQPAGRFEIDEIREWILQICRAVDDAHRHRLFHGEISPSNLFVVKSGRLTIAYFGVGRCIAGAIRRARGVDPADTAAVYLSPQQLDGESPSRSGDVYSIGAVLYELLSGEPPFQGNDLHAQIRGTVPKPVSECRAARGEGKPLPETWVQAIAACLQKQPADRPRTLLDLASRLTAERTPTSAPAPASTQVTEPVRPIPVVVKPQPAPEPKAVPASKGEAAPKKPEVAPAIVSKPAVPPPEPEPVVIVPLPRASPPPQKPVRTSVLIPVTDFREAEVADPKKSFRLIVASIVLVIGAIAVGGYFLTRSEEKPGQETVKPAAVASIPGPKPAAPAPSAAASASPAAPSIPAASVASRPKTESEIAIARLSQAFADQSAKVDSLRKSAETAASADQAQSKLKEAADAAARDAQTASDEKARAFSAVSKAMADAVSLKAKAEADAKKAEADAAEARKAADEKGRALDAAKKAADDAAAQFNKLQADQTRLDLESRAALKVAFDKKQQVDAAAKAAVASTSARRDSETALKQAEADAAQTQAALDKSRLPGTQAKQTPAAMTPAPPVALQKVSPTASPSPQIAPQKALPVATPPPQTAQQKAVPVATPSPPVEQAASPVGAPIILAKADTAPQTFQNVKTPNVNVRAPAKSKLGMTLENSLGMKFAPVGEVLFCIWPTRVEDFDAFAKATGYKSSAWRQPGFSQGADYPVVNVSWETGMAFCKWLTEKEQKGGILAPGEIYRLPTDLEWSAGVGLGPESGNTPEARDMDVPDVYPWGTQWPPPPGAGNYTGEETGSDVAIQGYDDGYAWTAPVGSFAANKLGLYDMGGNVWQWCMEWWNGEQKQKVLRGASWYNGGLKLSLLSSCRYHAAADSYSDNFGFRVVVASEGAKSGKK